VEGLAEAERLLGINRPPALKSRTFYGTVDPSVGLHSVIQERG